MITITLARGIALAVEGYLDVSGAAKEVEEEEDCGPNEIEPSQLLLKLFNCRLFYLGNLLASAPTTPIRQPRSTCQPGRLLSASNR